MKHVCWTAVLVLCVAGMAYGQMYEYRDANGNPVFTDNPPSGADVHEKKTGNGGVYHSTYVPAPSEETKTDGQDRGKAEPRKKNYGRVSVAMYMTPW